VTNSFSKKLLQSDFALDKIIAILMLVIGVVVIVWSLSRGHYGVFDPSVVAIASLLYLLFRGKLSKAESLLESRGTNRIRLFSHLIFIIGLTLSIWLLWSNLYYRPLLYFVMVLIAAGSIILDIFYLDEGKYSQVVVTLFKIVILCLSVYAGIYYQFPGISGVDCWWHNEWIQETVNLGHLTEGQILDSGGLIFPIFHLMGAITQIVTSLPSYSSVFASIGIFGVVSCVFIFLIGRKVANTKVGLLAALIVPLTDWGILFGSSSIVPNSLGFYFFSVILYLIFCRGRKMASDALLILLVSASLILTHTIASFVMLLSVIAIFIGIKLHEQISKSITPYKVVSLSFVVLFSIAMLTRWMQSPPGYTPFFDVTLKHFFSSLQYEAQFAVAAQPIAVTIPYENILLDQGGHLLLLLFSFIGGLILLHPRNRTGLRTALVLVAWLSLFVVYLSQLFGLTTILPGRWFLFIYVPVSILAVQGLFSISSFIKQKVGKLGLVMLVVLAIVFMMTTDHLANKDSPLILNGAIRTRYTQSELTAIETLSEMGCGRPKTDIFYGVIFPYIIGYDKYMNMVQGENEVFILRNYFLHRPEWNERYAERLHKGGVGAFTPENVVYSDYVKERGIDKGSLIYSNPNVKVYALPPVEQERP